jgi:hypothetical protein
VFSPRVVILSKAKDLGLRFFGLRPQNDEERVSLRMTGEGRFEDDEEGMFWGDDGAGMFSPGVPSS